MKYLKIENNKGHLLNESGDWIELDKVTKEDILFITGKALDEDDFKIDDFKEDDLQNPAHKIIYKQIHEKISDFVERKSALKDEISGMYKEAYDKYVNDTEVS